VAAERPCNAAGVFTRNLIKAAPVLYDQELLGRSHPQVRAVIANAGCANAVTGPEGMANARRMAELTAYALRCQPDEVLVLSTGVIGRQLPMDKITQGIAEVTSQIAEKGAGAAARAIMTTDTRPKVAQRTVEIGGQLVTIAGFAKGAGMIHPNMATMLAVITTDARIPANVLQLTLHDVVERSFNRISVDGDTSTNDTVLLLASGQVGIGETVAALARFSAALAELCIDLAKQIARDGEGATKLIEISVSGAADTAQAHTVANTIATSPLVKTAVHGGDPNWGRVLAAAGRSGAAIDPERVTLSFGPPQRQVTVLERGLPTSYVEAEAAALFRHDPVLIQLDLGLGEAATTVWTCDFSQAYVDINAHYTT
ncbi:MAG: bifunctional glutamate N-acetyltransferase/amino-acid acetyltransferase ArgJ, partial [Roseiflexaceae bacterium]|nr:bifunctional glutamate N-acetyltransferase/amino-acid acetyltransferase ArgJ [Roseiflexaceae bacterium]